MNSLIRKITLIMLIAFSLSIVGCLSGGNTGVKNPEKPPVEDPKDPPKEETKLPAYDPNGNKKPVITYFGTEDLDEPVAEAGQVITFNATAIDPEGKDVKITVKAVEKNGQKVLADNKWTVPSAAGIYQIIATANDGQVNSEPETISIKVLAKEGGVQIANLTAEKEGSKAAMSRAITSATSTIGNDKILLETGESATIRLSYVTNAITSVAYDFSVADNTGNIVALSSTPSGAAITNVYRYTAGTTAPTGNTITITFNIVNNSDPMDYATASVTFLVNTPPVISKVEFTGLSTTSIAPNETKTIKVYANDADPSPVLTYYYSMYEGTGNILQASNTTGEVEYKAGATVGNDKILVVVTDEKGSSANYLFTTVIVEPMYIALADDTAADYAAATDDTRVVEAAYDITTHTDGVTTTQIQRAMRTNDTALPLFYTGFEAFLDNAPTGTPVYEWTNTANGKTIGGSFSAQVAAPDFYAMYPGAHTIGVKATVGTMAVSTSDTLYINEPTIIENISFVDSDGNPVSLWNGTDANIPQVSTGQSMTLTVRVSDADNTRLNPDETMNTNLGANNGLFRDEAGKFIVKVLDAATWTAMANSTTQARINGGTGYTNTNTIKTTMSDIAVEIMPEASTGNKYILIRAADGMDNTADGTDYTITSTPAGLVALPDVNGIAKAFDNANTMAKDASTYGAIRIGYNPYKTNKTGAFYLVSTTAGGDGIGQWKVYDETAGAFIKATATNTDIVINEADVNHDGSLDSADALAAPYDWLLVDMSAPGDTFVDDEVAGDKIYFKTHCTQVVAAVQVVNGPRITTVEMNKYVTIGNKTTMTVYGNYDGKPATVSVRIKDDDGTKGTIEEAADNDGDSVKKEVWTYTAPSTKTVNYLNFIITIQDDSDADKKVTRDDVRVYLNQNPKIGAVNATSSVDTTNGVWAKKGARNISLSATVTDPDTDMIDEFGYIWSMQGTNVGSLNFQYTSSAIWDPYNGATALTATGGPYSNGHYQIQVQVYDKDSAGVGKTGVDARTIDIGINEDPDVGVNAAGTAIDGVVIAAANPFNTPVDNYSTTEGTEWLTNPTDDTTAGNGLGTTTVNFNVATGEYPGVKVKALLNGVTDEPDDRTSLNTMYYMTVGTKDGLALTTENFEYFSHTDATFGTTTKGLRWTPSVDLRKNGGTYWLHARVTDDKNGVAKGITDYTEKVLVTKDTLIADPAPGVVNVKVKVNEAAAWVDFGTSIDYDGAGTGIAAPQNYKAGTRFKFTLPIDGTVLARDTDKVYVNIDGIIDGVFTNTAASAVFIELAKNDQGTPSPIDDTFEGEYIVPKRDIDTNAAGNIVGLSKIRAVDLVGNVSAEAVAGTGTAVAALTAVNTLDMDYNPIVIGNITDQGTTVTNVLNNNGTTATGNALNGNTGLQVEATRVQASVLRIGSRVAIDLALADEFAASDAAAASATRKAAILDFSTLNPKAADGTDYAAIATNALRTVNGVQNQLVLNTAIALLGRYVSPADATALVLGENSSVSTWGATADTSYMIKARATDDAIYPTVAAEWPVDTALGNTDMKDKNLLDIVTAVGGQKGIDLKRPTVKKIDIYSYDKNALEGQIGYAPIGDRSAGTDAARFALIDYTLAGPTATTVALAKDIIDDGNITTAEIVRIQFDEPLFVGQDIAADDSDGLIGSTVNDYSLKVYQYRANGIDTDDVSIGALKYDDAAIVATLTTVDTVPLLTMRNYAYTTSGTGTTATSTVYVLLQSKQLTGTLTTAGTAVVAGTGTAFLSELAVGDIVEITGALGTVTNICKVLTVDSDTQFTATAVVAANGAARTAAKSIVHIPAGNHFEVVFADYKLDTTLDFSAGAAAANTSDRFKILCDQHGNAINASQNNYTKENGVLSW